MRKIIALLFPLLIGCTPKGFEPPMLEGPRKPPECDMFCRQEKARQERLEKLQQRGQKYKIPNQFELRNGCIVRVVETPNIIQWMEGPQYAYNAEIIINEWSQECSTMSDSDRKEIPEKDIIKARYKW